MIGYEKLLQGAAKQAEGLSRPQDGDYVGPDGLLYCGKCHTRKQRKGLPGEPDRVVNCLCRCQSEQKQAEKLAQDQAVNAHQLQKHRRQLIPNRLLRGWHFHSASETEVIQKCWNYAHALCAGKVENRGLLLWGGVGSGKTFAAACIANYALENGVSACVTSLPSINGATLDERREFLHAVPNYGLLVLDDLGTERDTATANETTFQVINTRYESKKPMIITTNLTVAQLHEPANQHQARIYDRVLEVCVPVFCGQASRRSDMAQANMEKMKSILQAEDKK